MDVASRNLVEGHAQDDLQVLSSHGPMRPFLHQPLVIPNTGWAGINFLLPFVSHSWPFEGRSRDLFNQSGWRGCLYCLSARDNGSDGGRWSNRRAFSNDAHCPLPEARQRLVLFWSHLGIHVLVEFGRHLCKRKKLKKKGYNEISTNEPNIYSCFLQFQGCAGRRQKVPTLNNKRREYTGP